MLTKFVVQSCTKTKFKNYCVVIEQLFDVNEDVFHIGTPQKYIFFAKTLYAKGHVSHVDPELFTILDDTFTFESTKGANKGKDVTIRTKLLVAKRYKSQNKIPTVSS